MLLPGSVTPGVLQGRLTEKLPTLSGPGLDLFHMDPFISRSVYILSTLAVHSSGWQCFLICLYEKRKPRCLAWLFKGRRLNEFRSGI